MSTSNEVDLELSDFIDTLPTTKPPRSSRSTSRRCAIRPVPRRSPKGRAAGKPVVAFKIGRSEAGAKAAVSHTGALAGSDRMYDALFKQLGVIRAKTFADLLDIPAALATGRKLRGKRVAILTSTGGAEQSFPIVSASPASRRPRRMLRLPLALASLQTGDHAELDRNPIDVTLAGLHPEMLRGAISALLASPTYDALTIIVGSSASVMPELMADAIQDCLPLSDKPVIAYVSPHAPEVGALLTQRGVPALRRRRAARRPLRHAHGGAKAPPEAASTATKGVDDSDFPPGSLDEAQAKAAVHPIRRTLRGRADRQVASGGGSSRARARRTRRAEDSCRARSRTRAKSAASRST